MSLLDIDIDICILAYLEERDSKSTPTPTPLCHPKWFAMALALKQRQFDKTGEETF